MKNLLIINSCCSDFQQQFEVKKIVKYFLLFVFVAFFTNCSQSDSGQIATEPVLLSPADKISGTYVGVGKKMPNRISLGSFSGCVTPPNWESNFVLETPIVRVTKVDDNTVTINISGGSISEIYSNISIIETNGDINFNFGSYNITSGYFLFSAGTKDISYITSNACLQGLPYYSGSSVLSDGVYYYSTIGHIDFTGTKK